VKKALPIGTVARMVGMSPEALRFYEKKKIIDSLVVDENGYRLYERPIIIHLLRARYLKSMGFSLPEVNKQNSQGIISYHGVMCKEGSSLEEWISDLDERTQQLKQEIKKMEKMLSKVEEYRDQVREIRSLNGIYRIEFGPEMLFLILSNDSDEMMNTPEFVNDVKKWVDAFPMARYAFLCSKDKLSLEKHNPNRGLCIPLSEAEQTELGTENTVTIRSSLCLHTIVRLNVMTGTSTDMLHDVVDYIERHNYGVAGDAYGMWIANAHEKDSFVKYYEVWIPITQN